MNDYLEAWDRRLRTAGFRITPQRQLVLEAVTHLRHATPEEILEQVGLVTHAHIGHGAPTYHVVDDTPHIHLVCSRCRKVESIDGDDFAKYANKLENDNGFVVNISHVALHGLCKKCANEGNVVTNHDH